ncbi:MAG: helix-turn-helix domain-containing protein [Bacteroidia bacterium]|nr:helix-turn-helix domain-containing protein [Bacteroidia bacterium]
METDFNAWYGRSDKGFLEMIGHFIRKTRINLNKTQQEIADNTGLNRSTIIQIEKGKGGTLISFIQILRALESLQLLSAFEVSKSISPLLLAEMEMKQRKRARKTKKDSSTKSDW